MGVSGLIDIDEEFLQAIEQQVRIEAIQFQVDFTSKQNRMEYFGIDYAQLDQFSLRLMDRTKLLKVSERILKQRDKMETRLATVKQKIIRDANKSLALTNFEGRIEAKDNEL